MSGGKALDVPPCPSSLSGNYNVPPCLSSLSDNYDVLSKRSNSLASSIEHKRRKLKHSGSFGSLYWASACDLTAEEIEKTVVDEALKFNEFLQRGRQEGQGPNEKK